jgi:hypothetical protein
MPWYRLYGLRVYGRHALPLRPLTVEGHPEGADLTIRLGREASPEGEVRWPAAPQVVQAGSPHFTMWTGVGAGGRHVRLRYTQDRHRADFVIGPHGRWVHATWRPEPILPDVLTMLTGSVAAYVLQLRGVTCLHASVVDVGGRAIALVGSTGAGKSTTAAAFVQQGCSLIADDIAALEARPGGFAVQSGPRRLRLYQEVAERVMGVQDDQPPLWSLDVNAPTKRVVDPNANAASDVAAAVSLSAVYLLERRHAAAPEVEALSPSAGLAKLVPNTSARIVLDHAGRAAEFATLGRLAATVPIRRLRRPNGLDTLEETCRVILADVHDVLNPGKRSVL